MRSLSSRQAGSYGLVRINALVLTEPVNSRMVGHSEVILWTDRFIEAGITPDQSDFWKSPVPEVGMGRHYLLLRAFPKGYFVAYTPAN